MKKKTKIKIKDTKKELEKFDKALTSQAFESELKRIYYKDGFDYVQKARMIEYLTRQKGVNVTQLAKKINMSRQELYRMKAFLKCSDKIMDWVMQGKIKPYQVGRIIFSLKEKDMDKIEEIIGKMIEEGMSYNEMDKFTTEINNKATFGNHLKMFMLQANMHLLKVLEKKGNFKHITPTKVGEIKREIDNLQKILNQVRLLVVSRLK